MKKLFITMICIFILPSLFSKDGSEIISFLTQEKVYLHTDKPFYLIGDTIWLKGYLVDAQSHKEKDAQSRFLYVELIDRKNKVIQRKKIKEKEGCFYNYMPLDNELAEGEYILRAYTTLMRNEGEAFFYTKQITIYNSVTSLLFTNLRFETDKKDGLYAVITFLQKNGEPYRRKQVEYMVRTKPYKNRFRRQKANDEGEIRIRIPPREDLSQYIDLTMIDGTLKINRKIHLPDVYDYEVGFYPEGGHLIDGMGQTIAFKAESTTGISPNIKGYVINQNADTLTSFLGEYEGIGSFRLTSRTGDTLYAILADEHNKWKKIKLPLVRSDAIALTVSQDDSLLHYRVLVPHGMVLQDSLQLLIHVRGTILHKSQFSMQQLSGTIQKKYIPEGIIHLTVFDTSGNALTERLAFIHQREAVFQVAFSGTPAQSRSLIKTGIRVLDKEGIPLQGNFSMGVTDNFAVQANKSDDNIRSFLLINSDLKGNIKNPGYYMDTPSPERERHLDQLMLTQGWRRFSVVADILKTKSETSKWQAEIEQIITGNVKGWFSRPPRKELEVIAMIPKHNYMQTITTDNNGNFKLVHNYPDYTGFIISLLGKGSWKYTLNINEETYPAAVVNWELNPQKDVHSSFLHEVREGYTILNGEKVYQIPEVVVQGISPYIGYSYKSIGSEYIEQKKGENALHLLNQMPDICIYWEAIGQAMTTNSGKKVVTSPPTGERYIGLRTRSLKDAEGKLISGFPCRKAIIYVDGQRIQDEKSLEMLKAEDIQFIDLLDRPISRDDISDQHEWLFSDDNPWVNKRSGRTRLGNRGQSIWITSFPNKRGRFIESDAKNAKLVPLGYAKNAEFYAPKYPTEESRKIINSDKRTTIHWEPNIRLNEKGETGLSFYTADRPSTYTVVIEGITDDGKVCRYVKQIK